MQRQLHPIHHPTSIIPHVQLLPQAHPSQGPAHNPLSPSSLIGLFTGTGGALGCVKSYCSSVGTGYVLVRENGGVLTYRVYGRGGGLWLGDIG